MAFTLFISFIILLRLSELVLSKQNEKWLLQQGAVEYGKAHYPFMIVLHVTFFIALIIEYLVTQPTSYNLFFILLYFILIVIKAWVVLSLGKFWNTKIYRIPSIKPITKGLYRHCKHPNYIIVIVEIAIIPLAFHLYYTAILFSFLNGIMLYVRIKEEDKALALYQT